MEVLNSELAADPSPDLLIGTRLRHMRKARNLSLKDLSHSSGFSISFLSQLERGSSSGSVRVLTKVTDALGVSLARLFEDEPEGLDRPPTIVQRRSDRRHLSFGRTGISKELVTPLKEQSKLDIYMITLEAGGDTGEDSYVHEGEEAGLILKGKVELIVDDRSHLLNEGDGFAFESKTPHKFRNPGNRLAQVVWVNSRW